MRSTIMVSHVHAQFHLDRSKHQIRPLHASSSAQGLLENNLEVFDIDARPEYVALSYICGPTSELTNPSSSTRYKSYLAIQEELTPTSLTHLPSK